MVSRHTVAATGRLLASEPERGVDPGRILHVITGLGRGGAEGMLVQVVRSVQHEVVQTVVTLKDGGDHTADIAALGVPVVSLGMRAGLPSLSALNKLRTIVRDYEPDVAMTWLYHADLMGTLATCTQPAPLLFWNIRCSDMDFERYGQSTRMTVRALQYLSTRPAAVAFNSWAGRHAHERLGYRPRRWTYLPNGVDLARWWPDEKLREEVRKELGLAPSDVVFVLVGRTDPKKDHGRFLDAFGRLISAYPTARAVLIGRGTEELSISPRLAIHVAALGERSDLPRLLQGCDVLVSSSRYGEGFQNAVVEGMATGLACIATDVGDARILLGTTGVVIQPSNTEALARAMMHMVEVGSERRRELGRMARARANEEWSLDRAVRRYRRLLLAGVRHVRRGR